MVQTVDQRSKERAHGGSAQHVGCRRLRRQPRQPAAALDAWKDQHGDLVAIQTRDDGILDERSPLGGDSCTERPDTHERARRQLEVFRQSAIEDEPALRMVWIEGLQRVTRAVVALIIEGGSRLFRVAPILLEDVGPGEPRLQLSVHGHELHAATRDGQADVAGAHHGAERKRARG